MSILIRHLPVGNRCPELPQDILMEIFAQLEVPDLVRAGSVCSSWHAAYTSLCSTGPCRQHQTPCLLYTSESSDPSAVGLYSLAEKKSYTLTLPDPPIQSRHIIGSSYGWIITVDERCEIHLVNPITREQITLPSVSTIEQVKLIFDDAGSASKYEYSWYTGMVVLSDTHTPSHFDPSELRDYLFDKAFLSSDPSTGDYFVVLIHNPAGQLSFVRAGDNKWTWLPPGDDYEDCLFQGGHLYACTSFREIHAFDHGASTVEQNIVLGNTKNYSGEKIYIVNDSCGELLQIWRSVDAPLGDEPLLGDEGDEDDSDDPPLGDEEDEYDSDLEPELGDGSRKCWTHTMKVHKVDLSSKRLVEVSGLSEHVLFVGRSQSHCYLAEDYPQLKANHAYFTDDSYTDVPWYKNYRCDIGVLDMENNSTEEIVSPQILSSSLCPVWLVPNPRRTNLVSHE